MFASGGRSSDFHPSRMTCRSSSLTNQRLSNLNFFFFLIGLERISARIGRWSDPQSLRYLLAVCGNFSCQSSFSTALSKRHLTVAPPDLFPTLKSIFPINGNSNVPQSLSNCLKGKKELQDLFLPPSFSLTRLSIVFLSFLVILLHVIVTKSWTASVFACGYLPLTFFVLLMFIDLDKIINCK